MRHEHKTFTSEAVELDGNEFIDCTFQSCNFFFAGKLGFTLKNSRISNDCQFTFTQYAANTLSVMKTIYGLGPWGRAHIVATFETIAPELKKPN